MRVSVDRDRCCGAGQCVLLAPDVFDQEDDGIVTLLTERPREADRRTVREAAAVCPTAAIQVSE